MRELKTFYISDFSGYKVRQQFSSIFLGFRNKDVWMGNHSKLSKPICELLIEIEKGQAL